MIDEAHGLAEDLVRFFKAEIGPRTLPGFRKKWLKTPADPRYRLLEGLPPYIERLQEVLASLQGSNELTKKIRDRIERVHSAVNQAEDILGKLKFGTVEWVHTYDSRSDKHTWRPLAVRSLLDSFWNHFNHILLSSATFFGIDALVRDSGFAHAGTSEWSSRTHSRQNERQSDCLRLHDLDIAWIPSRLSEPPTQWRRSRRRIPRKEE